ncbi:AAA-domain-containing protein [Trichocladium antarcticum]|uniref:AAA-domain-containing protein n=1 Tax=Trichocladium antarcticum TaxID=1450529 RepID=A0AAN6ZF98_9PEZI|nr:AAA-domain-containing protein [Trichocladium antarcticum]
MFGNMTASALSILQKTYDESYLTCSTAVYYESQGNEPEAMRCWRQALEQIYDHNANRVLPNFTPRSETEKALLGSLRQLELQCKERIDLLEALRISRQEAPANTPMATRPPPEVRDAGPPKQQEPGWIGNGTIPAVTYAELSRPNVLRRTSGHSRSPSLQKAAGNNGPQADGPTTPSVPRKPLAATPSLPSLPSPETKTSRGPSPERHTMRTTLRAGRLGEKMAKATLRRPSQKQGDGPGASKAAILAWGSLGQRDTADQGLRSSLELPRPLSNLPTQSEQTRRSSEALHMPWDSNTRRLATPRTRSPIKLSDRRISADLADMRQADGDLYARPSPISISAASSALNSLALKDSAERRSPQRELITRQRTAPPRTPQARKPSDFPETDASFVDGGESRLLRRKTSSDSAMASQKSASKALAASRSRFTPTPSGKRIGTPQAGSRRKESQPGRASSPPASDNSSSSFETPARKSRQKGRSERQREASIVADPQQVQFSDSSAEDEQTKAANSWKKRKVAILKKLPAGVDQQAAKQIFNEIIVQGDEVHWSDIAGLEIAKNALRETVVYPFLRPDLFMGLREPARGMLLFGPPGTGKTMLARAVATESKSTFFSISASSLTSKYLGESEKLVRALFALAKVLAPSIIFVDEIDSLLSQRSGSGEHEATRRIKTEFLIQWSDLQRAAAGREVAEKDRDRGDANRVLVLAATNLPWAIDEAARRRFVRRQYIPLPETETRAVQLRTLLKSQKHTLTDADIDTLVGLTDGFSGSDITALAKDAAMGPLRSLGEALLQMTMDDIRPIELADFVASLVTIRPSVSKTGLKEYEDWAREFGERGG